MVIKNKYNKNSTREYYDSFSDIYELIWDEQIHTGLFDCDKSLKSACLDMTRFLIKGVSIRPKDKILNVGCGSGKSDRLLVLEFQAKVIGIDISSRQLEKAKERAIYLGLDNITYQNASMTNIPLKDNSVDHILIQQSFFHCHDKKQAIREFYRILKKDGKIILEDSVKTEADSEEEVLEWFGKRLQINEMFTANQYVSMFEQNGFVLYESFDISSHLLQTYNAVIKFIRTNKKSIRDKINPNYFYSLDKEFGFPYSRDLVQRGKLGCMVMYFRRND